MCCGISSSSGSRMVTVLQEDTSGMLLCEDVPSQHSSGHLSVTSTVIDDWCREWVILLECPAVPGHSNFLILFSRASVPSFIKRARAVTGASPHWQFISIDLAIQFPTQWSPVAQSQFLWTSLCMDLWVLQQQIQHPMKIAGS